MLRFRFLLSPFAMRPKKGEGGAAQIDTMKGVKGQKV